MIDAIERGQVLNLPIHSERITFGLGWTSPASAGPSDYDLAAVLMSESGDVVDVVYHRCLSACGMCVRHLGDERGAKCHPAEDNEQIAVYPSMVPAIVKAIFFVASATPRSSEDAPGFLRLDKLHFSVASFDPARAEEKGGALEHVLRGADLKPFVDGNDFDPSSIAVCAMCRVSNGWVAKFDLACLPHASFGPAVPDLQALLRELPEVDASAVVVDRDTAVQPLPKVESLVVDAVLAAFHGKPREEIELPAVPKPHKKADEEEEEEEEAEEEDGEPEAPWPHAVRLVRVDLGWSGYPWFPPEKPKKEKPEGEESEEGEEAAEEEEEEEVEAPPEPECEVVCAVYNSKGEQLAVIDAGGDTDGIRAITDDDKKIKDPEFGEGRDPTGFPVKASLLIDLKKISPAARSIVFGLTSFGEEGFKPVERMFLRIVDVTDKKDRRNHRDLMVTRLVSPEGQHGDKNMVILGKVSREFTDSLYWRWRSTEGDSGRPPMPLMDYLRDQGSTLEMLQKGIEEKKAMDMQDKNPDEEEEEEDAPAKKMVEQDWHFRCRAMAFFGKGASVDDLERDLRDVAQFEGVRDAEGLRADSETRIVLPNGDLYLGGYQDDKRQGLGVYFFQNGAAYAGYFVEGSRQGRGLLVLPDGSRYCGQFMKDKYEGRGDYFYPDGALYRGTWKNGLRHGQGVYWYPGHESCLNGTWNEGFLSGEGVHEVPRHVSRGAYAKGVPSGEAVFTLSHQDRVRGLPFFAAEHILKDHGPTLTFVGTYVAPEKNPEEPEPDEEGNLPPYDPGPLLAKVGFHHVDGTVSDTHDTPFPPVDVDSPSTIPGDVLEEALGLGETLTDLIPDPPKPETDAKEEEEA